MRYKFLSIVIKGWDEGVPLMSLGEKATLHISYDYAYGSAGHPAGTLKPYLRNSSKV